MGGFSGGPMQFPDLSPFGGEAPEFQGLPAELPPGVSMSTPTPMGNMMAEMNPSLRS
jgi:hypothetical protein